MAKVGVKGLTIACKLARILFRQPRFSVNDADNAEDNEHRARLNDCAHDIATDAELGISAAQCGNF